MKNKENDKNKEKQRNTIKTMKNDEKRTKAMKTMEIEEKIMKNNENCRKNDDKLKVKQ